MEEYFANETSMAPWSGIWQRDMAEFVEQHTYSSILAPRRAGKSYFLSTLAAIYILEGRNVIFASPTLQQTGRILIQETHKQLKSEAARVCGVKPVKNTEYFSKWNTGGILTGLSLSGDAAVEGFDADLLIIDEAHRIAVEDYEKIMPTVGRALRRKTAKIIFTGIGSETPNSLLAQSHRRMHSSLLRITPEYIIEHDDTFITVFDEFKNNLTHKAYKLNIEVEDLTEGIHQVYPLIPEKLNYISQSINVPRQIYVGIDVGVTSDETVVIIIEKVWDQRNIIGIFKPIMNGFKKQAEQIVNYLKNEVQGTLMGISVERNGAGQGLYETLKEHIPSVKGVHINHQLKFAAIDKIQRYFEQCKMGTDIKEIRDELSLLNEDYLGENENKRRITHSDTHAAIIMAILAGV